MVDLSKYSPRYGGLFKSDGTVINEADLMSSTGVVTRPLMASGNRPADDPHSRIHQGVMYSCDAIFTALADDAAFNVILTTPSDDYPHCVFIPSLDGALDVAFYEAAAFTGGTALTISNHNRNSSNVFGGSAVHTPTISDDGTLIFQRHISGGTGPHAAGSTDGFDKEWDLKPSTNYLIRVINRSSAAQGGGIGLDFYSAPLIA